MLRVLFLVPLAWAIRIGPGVDLCHKSDPKFNECMCRSIETALFKWKDGIPQLGIPKIEPFLIPQLEIAPDKSTNVGLHHKYKNMLTYGIYVSEAYNGKFVMNDKECYWDFWVLTRHTHIEADYQLKGKILVFPLDSQGKCNLTLTNMRNHHRNWCERYKKNGRTHLRITRHVIDINADEVHFDFDNLMPGNEQISREILRVVNEDSAAIFKELKHAFEGVWGALHMQTANNLLAKIPEDEAFPQ